MLSFYLLFEINFLVVPPSAILETLYEILFQTLRKKFVEKLNDQRIKIPLFFFHWKAGIFMLSQTLQRDFAESFTFKAKTRQKFDEVTKKKIKNQVLKIELKKTNRF